MVSNKFNMNEDAFTVNDFDKAWLNLALDSRRWAEKCGGVPSSLNVELMTVTPHFENIEDVICDEIYAHEFVVGCVAWMTSKKIVRAVANTADSYFAQILMQKEDWLRPDNPRGVAVDDYKKKNAHRHADFDERAFLHLDPGISYMNWLEPIDCFRCVGELNTEKLSAFPRMHHKFLVLGAVAVGVFEDEPGEKCKATALIPQTVITGSYNMTHNARNSRENVVVIRNTSVGFQYLNEWAKMYAISEELNFSAEYFAPQFRFGT